jgi:hypothetical protein
MDFLGSQRASHTKVALFSARGSSSDEIKSTVFRLLYFRSSSVRVWLLYNLFVNRPTTMNIGTLGSDMDIVEGTVHCFVLSPEIRCKHCTEFI